MRLKWFCIILASAALPIFGFAQDLSKAVTFSCVAKRAGTAVQELSQASGVKMEAVGQAAEEVIFISVKDVPLKELMNRIATATSCEWQTANGTLRLVPNFTLQRQQAAAEQQRRLQSTRVALKELADSLKPKKDANPSESGDHGSISAGVTVDSTQGATLSMTGNGSPAQKAVARMALGLDAQAIAAMEPQDRLVFSSAPTRMQRNLPNTWQTSISQLIAEQNEFAKQYQKTQDTEPKSEEDAQAMKWVEQMGLMQQFKPINQPPAKVLLVFTRNGFFGGLSFHLNLYNEKGEAIFTGMGMLNVKDDESLMDFGDLSIDIPGQPKKPKPTPQADEKPIEFSKESIEIGQLLQPTMGEDTLAKQPSPELKAKLLRPDLYDPLSFSYSEGLMAIADRKNLNVVAALPDSMMGFLRASSKVPSTPSAYLAQLQDGKRTTTELADGWLVVKPANPYAARLTRTDRVALANVVGSADKKGLPTLDDLSAYAMKNEEPMRTPVGMIYLMLFAPSAISQGMGGLTSWDMLRLYGQLGAAQRQQLLSGTSLAFSNLTPDEIAIVRKMAYGAMTKIIVDRPGQKPKDDGGFFDMISQYFPAGTMDYRDEPTEIMPDGIPAGGMLTLKSTADYFAVPVTEKGTSNLRMGALGPDEIAMLKYMTEQPAFAATASMMPSMDRLRVGDRTTLDFNFLVAPNVHFQQTLHDDKLDEGKAVASLDSLPDGFKGRINKRLEALKKNPLPFGMGMPGGGGIPPRL